MAIAVTHFTDPGCPWAYSARPAHAVLRWRYGDALQWRSHAPRPPVRGDELARALGIPPGPEIGRLLAELEEAAFAGELAGTDQALDHARRLLATQGAERDQ